MMTKILNLKSGIMLEYQTMKLFLQSATIQVVLKAILVIKKHKSTVRSSRPVFLEIWQNSQENTCSRDSILIKLQAAGIKRVSGTRIFLWI